MSISIQLRKSEENKLLINLLWSGKHLYCAGENVRCHFSEYIAGLLSHDATMWRYQKMAMEKFADRKVRR